MGGDERRSDSRTPVTLVVDYEDGDDLVNDYTSNLSAGGTFVHTERELALGSELRLVLSFPGLLKPIAIAGVVRWVRGGSPDERGVGIEFHHYDERVRAELAAVIAAVQQKSPEVVRRVVRVLVVEDNPHVARFIRDGLTAGGRFRDVEFDFTVSGDGQVAIAQLDAGDYDAAIVDMYLPVMDGAHVIAHIRRTARSAAMPVIAVSAGGAAARATAMAAGADLFLDKPMRLRQIIDSMVSLVGLRPS